MERDVGIVEGKIQPPRAQQSKARPKQAAAQSAMRRSGSTRRPSLACAIGAEAVADEAGIETVS
ncbi:hypothetical protein GCM10025880_36860 [Methylorubrum aminovorans]|nr:hypothetical protein GCM10025880_36860 [Methylorubrum aminovorans]